MSSEQYIVIANAAFHDRRWAKTKITCRYGWHVTTKFQRILAGKYFAKVITYAELVANWGKEGLASPILIRKGGWHWTPPGSPEGKATAKIFQDIVDAR